MKKSKSQAINLNVAFKQNADMTNREREILAEVGKLTNFMPEKNIWRSQYWGNNLGASHWLGTLEDKRVVLKIQGVKPGIEESYMIDQFEKINRSVLIRPPKIIKLMPWSKTAGYEALFTEYVTGTKILEDKVLQNSQSVSKFFEYYIEYRKNCVPKSAWLPRPTKKNWVMGNFDQLVATSTKAYPNHQFRIPSDFEMAKDAYKVLEKVYKNTELEFMHGHFSCNDLLYEDKNKQKAVLFSNLFWKWRPPFFDAVFAYHWFMYELHHVEHITPPEVEKQRIIWLDEIFKITKASRSLEIEIFVNAALLERAVAGLLLDSFMVDNNKPIAEYLTKATRKEVVRLVSKLNSL